MPPIHVLIKPASSACNMACRYCFYRDVTANRSKAFEGPLSLDTMEAIIVSALAYADHFCSFSFQGGEPTLAGLSFYRQVIALQKKHNHKNLRIQNNVQTNGYALTEEWAVFFHENNFLIGLSLDGPAALHNFNRIDNREKGTFHQVMRTVRLFNKHAVAYNVLCVVTGRNARFIQQIYSFYRKNGFRWLQFIPCLEPLGATRGESDYFLSTEQYGKFLIRLFDLWYAELKSGSYISIRYFDNWISMLLGNYPEACSMTGRCTVQFVIEGDGGVYPCDFYVLDECRLGTIGQQSFAEMQRSPVAAKFIERSLHVPQACGDCPYFALCRNGCRRERFILENGEIGQNYFCQAFQAFFIARGDELARAAVLYRKMLQR